MVGVKVPANNCHTMVNNDLATTDTGTPPNIIAAGERSIGELDSTINKML